MLGKLLWKTGKNLPKLGLLAAVGGVAWSRLGVDHDIPSGPSLPGARLDVGDASGGTVAVYHHSEGSGVPVLLVHSVNAAASAYEMKPLFESFSGERPVYAMDLPGYGGSTRGDRAYTPDLMATAIASVLESIDAPVHVVALSLGAEFAARAAKAAPERVVTLTMLSPTGFGKVRSSESRGSGLLRAPVVSQAIYDGLTSRPSIRYFLAKSFAGPVDEGLVDHAYRTSHQRGARFAPLAFLSGELFTRDAVATLFEHLTVPTLVLHDRDAFTSFVRLPEFVVGRTDSWSVTRIADTKGLPQWDQTIATVSAIKDHWASHESKVASNSE